MQHNEFYRLVGLNNCKSECRISEIDTDEDIKSLPEKFNTFIDELKAEGCVQ